MKAPFYTAIAAALAAGAAQATPQQAIVQVRENAAQVLRILKKADGSNDAAVRREAENYAMPYFDFRRMTAQAVGAPWRSATPVQQKALSKEFQTLLIRTYSGTMLKFKNATVDVKNNPIINRGGKEVIVRVEVSQPGGRLVNMDFTTYQNGGKYRVYNVAVEGASLVTVYRNQFGETIKSKGIDGLIAELADKNNGR
ncbi:MAG: ABC transporter substrate-binding protein [Neisseria sp.]|nr:ABC transporter substrate-binding protein [Neisseria sp.]